MLSKTYNRFESRLSSLILAFMLGLLLVISHSHLALAQGEVPKIEYDQVYIHPFTEPDEQFFAQFEGSAGDLVYFLADYEGFVIGSVEIDLRDAVGRTVGFKDEYAFQKFVLAELPSDGLYTVVITAEEPEPVEYIVGLAGYLNDGLTATIEVDGFPILAGVRVPESGKFSITYNRVDGELGVSLNIITFSEFFNENVITVQGTSVHSWEGSISLDENSQYIAFIDRNFFRGGGNTATIEVELHSAE